MITKTLSGIPMLDEPYGGVFSNRSFLVTGAKDTGKTVMGLQFVQQGLEQSDRCLYLSTMVADDLGILAESLGFKLTAHIESEALTLLEYESFMHGSGAPGLDMLPPEGFEQLREIIHVNSIERVVLDTVLPWVSVRDPERMPQQVFSFTRSLDRLGVTTLLTLPKPVSTLAFRLKKSIEDVVPVSVLLQPAGPEGPSTFQVVKYLGEQKLVDKMPYRIKKGVGITAGTSSPDASERPAAHPGSSAGQEAVSNRPRFSNIRFSAPSSTPVSSSPEASMPESRPIEDHFEQPPVSPSPTPTFVKRASEHDAGSPAAAPDEPGSSREKDEEKPTSAPAPKEARLSSIWKPQSETATNRNPSG
jgi:KaiC/GvpD/RAD55 family RecA-like ATPase